MKRNMAWGTNLLASTLMLAALVPAALAGPPLICHKFNIGDARSLPWNSGQQDWYAPKPDYDLKHLVDDTVALLTDAAPVIVRMETIRRAALYSSKDISLSQALLSGIGTLALGNKQGRHDALRLFDYGYLIETMKQASMMKGSQSVSSNVNGYSLIQQALQLRGNDPEMEFAAAIVTVWPKNEHHQEHFRRAVAGAAGDPLLAVNLLDRFSDRGKTLAELRAY